MTPQPANKVFQLSVPTKQQFIHGVERVVLIFVAVTGGVWLKSPMPFGKAALVGAAWAGATAVYQAVLSSVTTL